MNSFQPKDPNFADRVWRKIEGNHFMHLVGFKIETVEPGIIKGQMPLEEKHRQQFGRLHGGVVTTLCDIVAGFAAYTLAPPDRDVVTGEIKISYLRPGRGDLIMATGTVLKPGRTLSFCEAEIHTRHEGKDIFIAKATTTMVLIPREDTF